MHLRNQYMEDIKQCKTSYEQSVIAIAVVSLFNRERAAEASKLKLLYCALVNVHFSSEDSPFGYFCYYFGY